MPEVMAYCQEPIIGFKIPYTLNGDQRNYYAGFHRPHRRRPRPRATCSTWKSRFPGKSAQEKEAKVDTARKLWIPAVNNEGAFGRWAFLEIRDPWDAKTRSASF